jgi:hypothetical protein
MVPQHVNMETKLAKDQSTLGDTSTRQFNDQMDNVPANHGLVSQSEGEIAANSSPGAHQPRANIANMPNEILFKIFKDLHPVFSACAGLTCKRLYAIHRHLHGTVKLLHLVILVC